MSDTTEFVVIQGKPLDFIIIIKQNGTTLPLELDSGDVFTFSVIRKSTQERIIQDKPMVLSDLTNGEVSGHITAEESATFPVHASGGDDWYISRPNLRVVISGTTLRQGEMTAIIEDAYVIVG